MSSKHDYRLNPNVDYVEILGFNYPPFICHSDNDLENYYCAPHLLKILDTLLQPVGDGNCLFKICAAKGCGKTFLIKKFISMANDKFCISLVSTTRGMNVVQLTIKILEGFKIGHTHKNQSERLDLLYCHLKALSAKSVMPVLIIDDVHNLDDVSLIYIKKLISHVKNNIGNSLFRIVLVGLNKIDNNLDFKALVDRAISLELPSFTVKQTEKYIRYRLKNAGNSLIHLFKRALVKRIHRKSGGAPAAINVLAHQYMIKEAKMLMMQFHNTIASSNETENNTETKVEPIKVELDIQKVEGSQRVNTFLSISVIAIILICHDKVDDLFIPSDLEKLDISISDNTFSFNGENNIVILEENVSKSKTSYLLNVEEKTVWNKNSALLKNFVLTADIESHKRQKPMYPVNN